MRKLLLSLLVGATSIASCFGAGPDPGPTPNDQAILLSWSPDRTTGNRSFFGSAVLDSTTVFVAVESGDTSAGAKSSAIWALAKDGSGKTVIADGLDGGIYLARDATDLYWVEGSSCKVHRVSKAGGASTVVADADTAPSGPTGNQCAVWDLVVDDGAIYVAVGNGTAGGTEIFDPCCDFNGHSARQANSLQRIDKTSHAVTQVAEVTSITCTDARCIWGDADTLYWFAQGGGVATVRGVPKAGGAARNVLSLANRGLIALAPIPGGVAAVSASHTGDGGTGFVISTTQAGTSAPLDIFVDDEHFGRDLGTDGTSLYFTVLDRSSDEGGTVSGFGVERVPLGTAHPDAHTLSIPRIDFIARRLLVGPTNVFLVDPYRVVSIPRALVP